MNFRKLLKNFVSDHDKFLEKLRARFAESTSQTFERKKYETLNQKRDDATLKPDEDSLWK